MKAIYEVQAFNDAQDTENRIHSDEVAQEFGFEGALVSGAVVFGHMTYLPMKVEGVGWLFDNQAELRLVKPAYDGDILTIELEAAVADDEVRCINAARTLLATLTNQAGMRDLNPAAYIEPAPTQKAREPISWDSLHIDEPAAAHDWHADEKTNLALTRQLEDDLDIYQGSAGLVHPFWIMRECNAAFARSYTLPAWIHVGSKIQFHQPLTVGDDIETRMVPIRKWEKKGHQFATLYVAFLVEGEVRVEVEHTAIFRIAPQRY